MKKVIFICTTLLFAGCSSMQKNHGLSTLYQEAYDATDPVKVETLLPGSTEEREAIGRVTDFFALFSPEKMREKTKQVYASNAYLNDTLKEYRGVEKIESYLVRAAEEVENCSFEMVDVASNKGNYYFRWIMRVQYKKFKKGELFTSTGVTHIRFNKEGKVIFHQDYWDSASNFFEKVPVVGWMIRKIKNRL